jgi:hypothetical protein
MSIHRFATRRDSNEADLVKLARKLGAHMVKTDIPTDYIGIWRGRIWLVEIKRPDGKFTKGQVAFLETAKSLGTPVLVWRTPEDVIAALSTSPYPTVPKAA